jgi:hypothetical protein
MFVIRMFSWVGVVMCVAATAMMVSAAFGVWFTSSEWDLSRW